MPYYMRVLGLQDVDIHTDQLKDAIALTGVTVNIELDPEEHPDRWTVLDILSDTGNPLVQIERNPIIPGSLGNEELAEFKELIQSFKPTSAVKWLSQYFGKVEVIYAFQVLSGAEEANNFDAINAVHTKIWQITGGITQADNEGFSNEAGYHILWQFQDDVKGKYDCSVKNWLGKWINFEMDLEDPAQQLQFKNGKVPDNARRL